MQNSELLSDGRLQDYWNLVKSMILRGKDFSAALDTVLEQKRLSPQKVMQFTEYCKQQKAIPIFPEKWIR